jgi:hypothetical protein
MRTIASTYQKAAATYRHLAPQHGRDTVRYHQYAARLDQLAARAPDSLTDSVNRATSGNDSDRALRVGPALTALFVWCAHPYGHRSAGAEGIGAPGRLAH